MSTRAPEGARTTVDPVHTPCPYGVLLDLTRAVGRTYEAAFADLGLTPKQYRLLVAIGRSGTGRNVDLARALGLAPSTLSRNLKPLVAAGWVEIDKGGDERSHRVRLTAYGLQRCSLGDRQWQLARGRVVQALGAPLVANLHALIEECRSALGCTASRSGTEPGAGNVPPVATCARVTSKPRRKEI